MQRILICNTFGGFGLSDEAIERLRQLGSDIDSDTDDRSNPVLLAVFDELGQEAAGRHCHLKAVEIPDGVEWVIDEYDGNEQVAEKHRIWR